MEKILIVVDNLERFKFYFELMKDIQGNYSFYYLTNKKTVQVLIEEKGLNCIFFNSKPSSIESNNIFIAKNSLEYVTGKIPSLSNCAKVLNSYEKQLNNLNISFDYVIMWNGTRLLERLINNKKITNDISVRKAKFAFCELSNIDGKIFIDPEGVNAESYLFNNTKSLLSGVVDREAFAKWRCNYIEEKKKQVTVPQSKHSRSLDFSLFHDYIYSKAGLSFFPSSIFNIIKGTLGRILSSKFIEKNSLDFIPDEKFLFVPLQVSADSQIKFNSNGNENLDIIKEGIKKAKVKNYSVVFKLHPSENDYFSLKTICNEINLSENAYISKVNTTDLISRSESVFTINSTVGLEAIILGKKVEFLGKSVYQHLTSDDEVWKYINDWLFCCDYFSVKPNGEAFLNEVRLKNEVL